MIFPAILQIRKRFLALENLPDSRSLVSVLIRRLRKVDFVRAKHCAAVAKICHRQAAFSSAKLGAVSKTLLFTLAAIADVVIAILAYRRGRVVIPIILVIAGICFTIAAIGSALGRGGPK